LCMVGDRALTDVVFGNLHGMLTVRAQTKIKRSSRRSFHRSAFAKDGASSHVSCRTVTLSIVV
jgi:predicted HAD superfamily phosphohydrolase YqeG